MSLKNVVITLLLAVAASLLARPAALRAAPSADWMNTPGALAEYAEESVFGGRVALYSAGPAKGEPVVLLHGLGKPAARDWAKVIPALAQRYRVYALDLPGFGESDKGNHLYSPDNFARVIGSVLEKRVPRPFTLVGHSMGGPVALAYAAEYPQRVSRLVLVDAAGVLHRSVYAEFLMRVGAQRVIGLDSMWFEQVVRAIQIRAENWPLRGELALERAGVRRRLLRGDPSAISAFAMVEHDFSRTLREIAVPTLIVWGADDIIAPPRTGQALASAIPHARLVVMEGAGHAPMVQMPDRFNPILIDEIDGRQLAAQPYALPKRPIAGNRTARCDVTRGEDFTGDYALLVLENCHNVRIANARIGRLQSTHSNASIVNSHVDRIEARNSRLELTGGSVATTLILDGSNVDAAATRFESPALATNSGELPVVVRLSVAEVSRPGYAPRPLHDIFHLVPGETLIR
jgi:pimeloyl-ACP methyl ester carboxylesterase